MKRTKGSRNGARGFGYNSPVTAPTMPKIALAVSIITMGLGCLIQIGYSAPLLPFKLGDPIQTPLTGMMATDNIGDLTCRHGLMHRLLYVFPLDVSASNFNPTGAVVFIDSTNHVRVILLSPDGKGDDVAVVGDKTGKGMITHIGTAQDAVFRGDVCFFLYGETA